MKTVQAKIGNTLLVQSENTLEIEGSHYFPQEALHQEFFEESDLVTTCPWKGQAHYYNITLSDGERVENGAWYYPSPPTEATEIVGEDFSNYVAFGNEVTVK